jgi:hypothetical protein
MKESDVRTAEGICTREDKDKDKDEATQCCFVLVMGCYFLLGVCLRSGLAGTAGSLRYRNRSPVKCCQWLASECLEPG